MFGYNIPSIFGRKLYTYFFFVFNEWTGGKKAKIKKMYVGLSDLQNLINKFD